MNGTIAGAVRLERIHTGRNVSVYQGSDGEKYLLRPVDRDYAGKRKPPRYYLLRQTGKEKPVYLSGMFETEQDGVFSLDLKDSIGVKHMFRLTIVDGGQVAMLEPGKAA